MKMILDTIGTGVEKAELRVKRSAKNKKAERRSKKLRFIGLAHQNKVQWASGLLYRP